MHTKSYALLFFLVSFINSFPTMADSLTNAPTTTADPCAGPGALLSVLDRPTVGDSTCVVPTHHLVIETGYQTLSMLNSGHAYTYPQLEARFGLPNDTEFVFIAPSLFHQQFSGLTSAVVGIKHRITYTDKWMTTAEGLMTLPSGSATYGSEGMGAAINGLASYALTPTFGISAMLGFATQTLSAANGGLRYQSINPDFVATWQPINQIQFYGEIYGQMHVGPNQGPGYNADGGVQYLVTKNVEVDVEGGVRLQSNLGGFARYIGLGAGFYI